MTNDDASREHPDLGTLVDYLHRELPPGSDAALLTHLESCRPCAAAYEEQARIGEALRSQARASERELPPGVVASIWSAVEREGAGQESWWERLVAAFRPVVAVPLLVALAIAFFVFGVPAMHGGTAVARTVDAGYLLDDHAALSSTVPFSESAVVPASLEQDRPGGDQQWVADAGAANGAATH
jgi:anti-sigma factor RsiW